MADEVYQHNINGDYEFCSFRKALKELGSPYAESVEMISFHSVSKGILGECGCRGGYMELTNIDPRVEAEILKSLSVVLSSSTVGQLAMDMMINPPTKETTT